MQKSQPSRTTEPTAKQSAVAVGTLVDEANMLLIFRLEGQSFAIKVDHVNEILDPQEPTPVPNAGDFAPGLINVRGVVVPVLDLRQRMGMVAGKGVETSRMIVFEHVIADSRIKLAFSADSVEEVFEGEVAQLEKVPELGAVWPQEYLMGALRHNNELVILLDTETLFNPSIATAI